MRHGAALRQALGRLASERRLQQIRHHLRFSLKDQCEGSLTSQIRMRTIHPSEHAFLLSSKESVLAWMNSPHQDLGGETPLTLILQGKAQVVADLLEAALAGQPS